MPAPQPCHGRPARSDDEHTDDTCCQPCASLHGARRGIGMMATDTFWWFVASPWALRPDTLLGTTLLLVAAALLGELVWRALRWPRLIGYTAVGTVLALAGLNADPSREALRLAVDVALALLLFETGARLNLHWLVRNPWLLATSVAEAALSAIAVYAVARALGLEAEPSAVLAVVGISVSPAVVQRVVGECGAAGQVTEPVLALTALSAGMLLSRPHTWSAALPAVTSSLFGSLPPGAALGSVVALIAR